MENPKWQALLEFIKENPFCKMEIEFKDGNPYLAQNIKESIKF